MSDFSNLLDSLKQFPLSECILALIGSLRDLGMKIDAELNVVEGSSLGRRHLRDKVTESMIGLWRRHGGISQNILHKFLIFFVTLGLEILRL